jgi:hypothetical protein
MFRSPEEVTPSDPESSSDDETLEEISKKVESEVQEAENADVPQHTAVPFQTVLRKPTCSTAPSSKIGVTTRSSRL